MDFFRRITSNFEHRPHDLPRWPGDQGHGLGQAEHRHRPGIPGLPGLDPDDQEAGPDPERGRAPRQDEEECLGLRGESLRPDALRGTRELPRSRGAGLRLQVQAGLHGYFKDFYRWFEIRPKVTHGTF